MLFLKLSGKFSKFGCTGTPNHRRVLIAKLNKFFPELFFIGSRSTVTTLEKLASTLSLREPIPLCKFDDQRCVHILNFSIA